MIYSPLIREPLTDALCPPHSSPGVAGNSPTTHLLSFILAKTCAPERDSRSRVPWAYTDTSSFQVLEFTFKRQDPL